MIEHSCVQWRTKPNRITCYFCPLLTNAVANAIDFHGKNLRKRKMFTLFSKWIRLFFGPIKRPLLSTGRTNWPPSSALPATAVQRAPPLTSANNKCVAIGFRLNEWMIEWNRQQEQNEIYKQNIKLLNFDDKVNQYYTTLIMIIT